VARVVDERRTLGWLAVAATALVLWLAWPFAVALLLGTLTAFTIEPAFHWLARRTRRPTLSGVLVVAATGIVVVSSAFVFVSLFVSRLVEFTIGARDALRPGGALATSATTTTEWLNRYHINTSSLLSRLEEGLGEIASKSATVAAAVASVTASALLGLFFALLAMYVVLRYWPKLVSGVVSVSPLEERHTREVLEEFRRAGRTTLAGTVVTGLAQGAFAAIGYWISGVPQPAFFGAATAVASLVPAVGTLLVWVPAGLYLFFTGHATRAVVELVWCSSTVIALSDYVVRPKLVGDEGTPAILTFIALFGGLEIFGLAGLLVGPILMSIAISTLRLYVRETADERPPAKTASHFR
jgi:predicted PurR-regulated permease PerM